MAVIIGIWHGVIYLALTVIGLLEDLWSND